MSAATFSGQVLALVLPENVRSASANELLREADTARDNGQWLKAAAYYQAVLRQDAGAVGLIRQFGHMLKEAGYYKEAELAYRLYCDAEPADPDIYLQLGHLFMRQEREEEALPWYIKALELAEADTPLAVDARRSVEQLQNLPYVRQRRKVLRLTDERRFEEAYEILLPLLDQPAGAELYGIAGNVCKELRRLEEARDYYARFRAFKGHDDLETAFEIELQLGHLEKIAHNYLEAMVHYGKAEVLLDKSSRNDVSADYLVGEMKSMLKMVTSAITIV